MQWNNVIFPHKWRKLNHNCKENWKSAELNILKSRNFMFEIYLIASMAPPSQLPTTLPFSRCIHTLKLDPVELRSPQHSAKLPDLQYALGRDTGIGTWYPTLSVTQHLWSTYTAKRVAYPWPVRIGYGYMHDMTHVGHDLMRVNGQTVSDTVNIEVDMAICGFVNESGSIPYLIRNIYPNPSTNSPQLIDSFLKYLSSITANPVRVSIDNSLYSMTMTAASIDILCLDWWLTLLLDDNSGLNDFWIDDSINDYSFERRLWLQRVH